MTGADKNNLAIWVVTPSGKLLADQIAPGFAQARMFVSERLAQPASDCAVFSSLADAVNEPWLRGKGLGNDNGLTLKDL